MTAGITGQDAPRIPGDELDEAHRLGAVDAVSPPCEAALRW
jgi:hypothetical protein